MAKGILFVCTGNTCRSSMAEALARHWLAVNASGLGVKVVSAGLAAWPGSPASSEAVTVMGDMRIDLTGHRAQVVSHELMAESALVLTMTAHHKEVLAANFPQYKEKIYTLSEYAFGSGGSDVCDPFGQPVEVYRDCAATLKEMIQKSLRKFLSQ